MLKAGDGMLLDGVPVHANARVRAGQVISVTLVEPGASLAEPEDLPVTIVYRDEDLLVIDKSAPLACQSSSKQPGGALENRLQALFEKEGASGFLFRPVNRLDKGTSGLMTVALNAHSQRLLTAQLHTPAFVRDYLAVVAGAPNPASGAIDLPIGKADGATIRREIRPDGKAARTLYETIDSKNGLSLVRLRLDTGRTHQIRVHMQAVGCPVFGDFLYGREEERLPGRFALHSAYLSFVHPATGETLRFSSPLPDELANLMR